MKKSKFNILFEDVMDTLQNSQISYQLLQDFEQETREAFTTLPFEQQIQYIKHMQRRHWMDQDKLDALKNIAFEMFGDNFETNPFMFIEHQKQLKRLAKLNKQK